uniref:Uncharacterized protein n=1 Tax=Oryza glaberrima TaxID=4538 RepID=I1PGI3_ORYGL
MPATRRSRGEIARYLEWPRDPPTFHPNKAAPRTAQKASKRAEAIDPASKIPSRSRPLPTQSIKICRETSSKAAIFPPEISSEVSPRPPPLKQK